MALKQPKLLAPNVCLQKVHLEDVYPGSPYHQWMNDAETVKYLESRHYPQDPESIRNYVKQMNQNPDVYFYAIRYGSRPSIEYNPSLTPHIGNIKLGPINRIHLFADIGIVIDKRFWGKGIGTTAVRLVSEFAFNIIGLHKLWAGVLSPNTASSAIFLKNGFMIEGTQRCQYLVDGIWCDDILLGKVNPREIAK